MSEILENDPEELGNDVVDESDDEGGDDNGNGTVDESDDEGGDDNGNGTVDESDDEGGDDNGSGTVDESDDEGGDDNGNGTIDEGGDGEGDDEGDGGGDGEGDDENGSDEESVSFLDRSILVDVRSSCNLETTDQSFDKQLIPLINAHLMNAHMFGVGYDGFIITGETETWRSLLGDNGEKLAGIKTWLGYRTLLQFDPPENATVNAAYQDAANKIEWMLRSKSEIDGHVKAYVPHRTAVYEELYDD